eukprot:COSAG02_NODE_8529_length_2535_cov_1.605090_2_plen_67_part_00
MIISILNMLTLLTEHVACLEAKLERRGHLERSVSEQGSTGTDEEPLSARLGRMEKSGSLVPSCVQP